MLAYTFPSTARHTANAEKCEAAIQTDSNQRSCYDKNVDGEINDNGGADTAGINIMLTFLVLILLVVMMMRMLMVTTVAMAGLVQPVSSDSSHQPVKKRETRCRQLMPNKSKSSPARSLQ